MYLQDIWVILNGEHSDENEIDKDGPWKSQCNMLTGIEDIEGQWRSTHQKGRGVLARSPEDGIREEGIRNQRQLYWLSFKRHARYTLHAEGYILSKYTHLLYLSSALTRTSTYNCASYLARFKLRNHYGIRIRNR